MIQTSCRAVLVDMSQWCVWAPKVASSILDCIGRIMVSRFEGSDYCPLLSTRDITSGIPCPVLVPTVQEKYQLSSTEGNQNGCKIKTAISEDDKKFNEMASMGMCTATWLQSIKMVPDSSQRCLVVEWEAMDPSGNKRNSDYMLDFWVFFNHLGGQLGCPERLCNFYLWRYSRLDWSPRAAWSNKALCKQGPGLYEPCRSLPT